MTSLVELATLDPELFEDLSKWHEFEIVNGPSKWDLMLALFEGGSSPKHERVDFTLLDGSKEVEFEAMIYGLLRDGDEGWELEAELFSFDFREVEACPVIYLGRRRSGLMRYNSQRRSGRLILPRKQS